MNKLSIALLQKLLALALILGCAGGVAAAQEQAKVTRLSFGGRFATMRPEQKELLRRWVTEYNRINRTRLTPAKVYDELPMSFKTAYDAVTHALLTSSLTNEQGQPLGTALSLVEMVESIHGKIDGAPGDQQFRLYVLLKKDAVDKLYAAREFKRAGDNSVFHKGYPLNFRQQGGAPSIQFSVTRIGRRADIDVDYRSSAPYKALFDGHLTAANSDVRAGNNYERHVRRWQGFQNWWQNLLDRLIIEEGSSDEIVETFKISEAPHAASSKEVHEAIYDFFNSWLVERKPLEAAAYISVQSYPCIVAFEDGSQADSPLAQARIIKQMRNVNAALGKVTRLESVIRGVAMYAPGARPVTHSYGELFALEQLPDEVAYEMDCRIRLKMKLAEDVPKPDKGFSNFYGAIVKFENDPMILFQVWSKEGKSWKLVAWHFEHPFKSPDAPMIAARPEHSIQKAIAKADEELAGQTREFMTEWLLKHNPDEALKRVAPSAADCVTEGQELAVLKERDPRQRVRELLDMIAKEAGSGKTLDELLVAPDVTHEHVEPLVHSESKAYVLARVSDDLSAMFHCSRRLADKRFGKGHAEGEPQFTSNHYKTIFQLKRGGEHPAALALLWEKQDSAWKVIAFHILAH